MALIVEDGSGMNDATSFVSRADYIAYALARGVTVASDDAADVQLVKAMDFLVSKCWNGEPTVETQALPFPRTVYKYDGALKYPNDEVPSGMKRAQMDLALAVKSGVVLMPNSTGGAAVKKEKVGPIETEYETAMTYDLPQLPAVDAAIRPYMCGQGGIINVVRV